MNINIFIQLNLKIGDYIWIMNEKGEGSHGNYNGNFDPLNQTFQFRNHSNGQTETIEISKLQSFQIH